MMIKKLIVLILLLIVVLSFPMTCYADYTTNITATGNNSYVNSVVCSSDNMTSSINSLYNNGYRSVISPYSTQLIHINTSIRVYFNTTWITSSNASNNRANYENYINNLFSQDAFSPNGNNLQIYNLIVNTQQHNTSAYIVNNSTSLLTQDIFEINIDFDMPVTNYQLAFSSNASVLNFSIVDFYAFNTKFTTGGITYKLYEITMPSAGYNSSFTLTFKNTINNVNYLYVGNEYFLNCDDNVWKENFALNVANKCQLNNVIYSNATQTIYTNFAYINFKDSIRFDSINYNCTSNGSSSNYRYNASDSYDVYLQCAVFTPLLCNNIGDYIASDSNGNSTPLTLTYYDCEWYELHYQIANAFIFMLTEFPILSDITNLIYSLFVMIKSSFEVLLNFDVFGIIFGVGMFAIVFGFILKYLIGE